MRVCIHCKTEKEWDIVAKSLGRTSKVGFRSVGDSIELLNPNSSWTKSNHLHSSTLSFIDFALWLANYEIF